MLKVLLCMLCILIEAPRYREVYLERAYSVVVDFAKSIEQYQRSFSQHMRLKEVVDDIGRNLDSQQDEQRLVFAINDLKYNVPILNSILKQNKRAQTKYLQVKDLLLKLFDTLYYQTQSIKVLYFQDREAWLKLKGTVEEAKHALLLNYDEYGAQQGISVEYMTDIVDFYDKSTDSLKYTAKKYLVFVESIQKIETFLNDGQITSTEVFRERLQCIQDKTQNISLFFNS